MGIPEDPIAYLSLFAGKMSDPFILLFLRADAVACISLTLDIMNDASTAACICGTNIMVPTSTSRNYTVLWQAPLSKMQFGEPGNQGSFSK